MLATVDPDARRRSYEVARDERQPVLRQAVDVARGLRKLGANSAK